MDRMLLPVVMVRHHPVILSALRSEFPVLDLGFWGVERSAQRPEPADVDASFVSEITDWFRCAEPTDSPLLATVPRV